MDSLRSLIDVVFFSSSLLISPLYLLSFVLIAYGVYRYRRETGGFFRWLFPRDIYTHRSLRMDVTLFSVVQVINYFGIFARFGATPAVAAYVASVAPIAPLADLNLSPVGLALLLFVAADFVIYWIHRWHHHVSVLWPLHAVHHSASVLSPITTYRQHPLSPLVTTSIQTIMLGGIFGILVGTFDPSATPLEIAGANAFVVIVNLTTTNFQHTHIWISFGPVLERILISPAQHQVHHSTNPAHFNKNFGQTFAIWDWVFGSLYVTKKHEVIEFGLNDKADAPLMTHRLWPILWSPVQRIIAQSTGR